jgi:uridine kinase
MSSDIFDLKIGKNIYHVDYDHSTGKFTDIESIESSDNVIVCGLHNLYKKNDILFDLKIFMDTDEKLKRNWKIKRDVLERGQPIENVIKNIDDRKEDFVKYILPQRENSDIIINFFDEENLSLRLIISNKFDMYNVIRILNDYNISFNYKINNDNFELIFSEFESNKVKFNIPIENDYYDYIILILYSIIKIE